MSLSVTELKPSDREQTHPSPSSMELFCSIFSLSHETQRDRNFPTALSSVCFYSSSSHVNSVSTLCRRFFLTPGQHKTKKKEEKREGIKVIWRRSEDRKMGGSLPMVGGCKWRIFKVSNPNSSRILGSHQPWGAGSYGESQRGSMHMAKDQVRLWFPKTTLFRMKHNFLPFHEQIQNYEKKQGLILGKSCKLRI